MALISVSNNALQNITAVPASIPTGALTLIKSITASSSASIEFINGTDGVVLDGTYSSYVFSFVNIHGSTGYGLQFNASTDSGSNYNVTKTTTSFRAYHDEGDGYNGFEYQASRDLAQSTAFQDLVGAIGTDNDHNASGILQLFNPSSNVYVKHFISRINTTYGASQEELVAGYFNNTNPINAVRFSMASGNIDDGIIKLYGVS